jgi:hypothetical protein
MASGNRARGSASEICGLTEPEVRQLQIALPMKKARSTSTTRPTTPRKSRHAAASADTGRPDGLSNNGQGIAAGGATNGVNGTAHASPPDVDAISLRAYEIFKARDGQAGDPLADWLQAEAELRTGSTAKA